MFVSHRNIQVPWPPSGPILREPRTGGGHRSGPLVGPGPPRTATREEQGTPGGAQGPQCATREQPLCPRIFAKPGRHRTLERSAAVGSFVWSAVQRQAVDEDVERGPEV